jgi:hypothetical protein
VEQVGGGGESGRRMNMGQTMYTDIYKCKNDTSSRNQEGAWREHVCGRIQV